VNGADIMEVMNMTDSDGYKKIDALLTPMGQLKHAGCRDVDYRNGLCYTPHGAFLPGSRECRTQCLYYYDGDHIDKELNK
jgi:hypothetical protein